MRVTSPARTALDLARRYPTHVAVAAIDALAQAVEVKLADIELLVDRYQGRRGMKAARAAIELVDGGAQSPKETWLRLLLMSAGFPRPQTQIAVRNEWGWAEAYLDMGWEDIKVAVEYDGDQHRSSRYQYVKDIRRLEMLEQRYGWIVVRVIAEDHPEDIIRRVAEAQRRPLASVTPARKIEPKFAVALRSRDRKAEARSGSRRLISSAASAASASTSAPNRSQPTLASPLMVS